MITTLYASILALFYVFLTFYVIGGRYKSKTGLGDGGNPALLRRIRIHANFSEYVPLALILLYLVDDAQTSPLYVHILGLMLLIGRILHAWGLSESDTSSFGRMAGMILTLLMIIFSAVILLWQFFVLRATGF